MKINAVMSTSEDICFSRNTANVFILEIQNFCFFQVTARDLVWSDVAKRPCPRRQSGSRDQPLLERAERASRRAPSRGVCGNCCRRKKRYSESQGYLMEER